MKKLIVPASIAGALAMGMGQAMAATYDLCAGETTKTMPDGTIVSMWGYAMGAAAGGVCVNAPSVPGPLLTVAHDDTSGLTVNLHNTLPTMNGAQVPVSIVIPGQVSTMTPVYNSDGRVRSFTQESMPGAPQSYVWPDVQPGSYAYHSGTHPAVQVQMGLYGAMIKNSGAGEAYPGVAYDNEVMLYYSEIDPALHTAVDADDYGPGKGTTSTIGYQPKYFLVNGEVFTDKASATITAGNVGERTLLRLFNMGLEPHTPMLQGLRMQLVAEDGKPYRYAGDQYAALLAAGKTKDAIITPAAEGTYTVSDRMLSLTNSMTAPGGLMSFLSVGAGTPPVSDTVTIVRTRFTATNELRVWANSTASPAAVLTVTGFGQMQSFPANTDFNYRLFVAASANPGSVSVTSNQGGSDTQAVPFTAPPVAADDAYGTDEDSALNVAAPGLLANDNIGGWFANANVALQAVLVSGPTTGSVALNPDGSFSYTPNANFNGADSFTYRANVVNTTNSNVLDSSAVATVNISIDPVNDPPVAAGEAYQVNANTTLNVAAPGVLSNDSDVEGGGLTAVLASGTSNGSLILNAGGSFVYTPNTGAVSDSFSYRANDGELNSAIATVTITVNNTAPNVPPVANDDSVRTSRNTPVTINVTANDTDVDGTINVTSVVIVRQPDNGSVVVNGNGTVTYTPRLNFRGTDVFRYTVRDDDGDTSNSARVRVNVR